MVKTQEIKHKISTFPKKNEIGFTDLELIELLKLFPNIHMDKFNDSLIGNTCQIIDKEIINYIWDVEKAIICGLENRDLTNAEWD